MSFWWSCHGPASPGITWLVDVDDKQCAPDLPFIECPFSAGACLPELKGKACFLAKLDMESCPQWVISDRNGSGCSSLSSFGSVPPRKRAPSPFFFLVFIRKQFNTVNIQQHVCPHEGRSYLCLWSVFMHLLSHSFLCPCCPSIFSYLAITYLDSHHSHLMFKHSSCHMLLSHCRSEIRGALLWSWRAVVHHSLMISLPKHTWLISGFVVVFEEGNDQAVLVAGPLGP